MGPFCIQLLALKSFSVTALALYSCLQQACQLQAEQHGKVPRTFPAGNSLDLMSRLIDISALAAHLKVLKGEGQADGIEAQLLQAPRNGGKVLGQAIVALAQVAGRCQPSIEPVPAAFSRGERRQAGA